MHFYLLKPQLSFYTTSGIQSNAQRWHEL